VCATNRKHNEIGDNYAKVLAATKVKGYPFVKVDPSPKAGTEEAPIGGPTTRNCSI